MCGWISAAQSQPKEQTTVKTVVGRCNVMHKSQAAQFVRGRCHVGADPYSRFDEDLLNTWLDIEQ